MKACWTCRRRRLICDGGLPHCSKCKINGVECLGYVKPLTWVGGAANRGHLKDWKSEDINKPSKICHNRPSSGSQGSSSPSSDLSSVASPVRCHFVNPLLTEPIFQDLNHDSRLLLNYFEKRICRSFVLVDGEANPYRKLLSAVGSSDGVSSAIKAIAACHMIHGTTGVPVFSGRSYDAPRKPILPQSPPESSLGIPVETLLGYLVKFKTDALQYLAKAVANPTKYSEGHMLATLILLLILEMWECGGGGWNFHLEGAKTLLGLWRKTGQLTRGTELWNLLHGLIMLETFGATLLLPGALSKPLRLLLSGSDSPTTVPADVSMIGCPEEITCGIDHVTAKRQQYINSAQAAVLPGSEKHPAGDMEMDMSSLETTLMTLELFNIDVWAAEITDTSTNPSTLSLQDFTHLGHLWRIAAMIYTKRVLGSFKKESPQLQHLVDQVILEHSHVKHLDDVNKVMLWIVFVTGAESTTPLQRQWASEMLDRLWRIHLCANVRNAAVVLQNQWRKMDEVLARTGEHQPEAWDWTTEISLLNNSWLFF